MATTQLNAPLTAVYVYAIVKAVRRPAAGRVPAGVPGATRPRLEPLARGLWVAAADVPLDVYGTGALEPRLRDLDWVAEVAVGHEGIVEHLARLRGVTVVPMKLFTMFTSIANAKSGIGAGRRAIDSAMRRIAGCDEWGVRISRIPGAVTAGAGRTRAAEGQRAGAGAAFLVARKAARDADKDARARALAVSEEVYAALARVSREARRRDARPVAGATPPILEAAFLVPARSKARFKAEARRRAAACAAAGAQMTLTGPWPAYTFVGGEA